VRPCRGEAMGFESDGSLPAAQLFVSFPISVFFDKIRGWTGVSNFVKSGVFLKNQP
jgi:hypothetical protein